jgi:c(7)-type cytochrome triheme protein
MNQTETAISESTSLKYFLALIDGLFVVFVLLAALTFGIAEGADKPPEKLVFEAKTGAVTFDHAKHSQQAKNNCAVCHDKLFPQSLAPLNYKAGLHKPAEAKKQSCAGCHVAAGAAFASKGNCNTCHQK